MYFVYRILIPPLKDTDRQDTLWIFSPHNRWLAFFAVFAKEAWSFMQIWHCLIEMTSNEFPCMVTSYLYNLRPRMKLY